MKIVNPRPPVVPCSWITGVHSHVLNINCDLKIVPCCLVTDQEIVFGDLREKSLRGIFYDHQWRDFLSAHRKMALEESYPYCWNCLHDPVHDLADVIKYSVL